MVNSKYFLGPAGKKCRKKFLFSLLVLAIIFINLQKLSSAAIIRGTVYDKDTNPTRGALLEINTTPIQRFVASDGTYLFSLPPGVYNISAFIDTQQEYWTASEVINVPDNGRYLLDLFMKAEPKFPSEPEVPVEDASGLPKIYKAYALYAGGALLGLALVGFSYWLIRKGIDPNAKHHEHKKVHGETKDEKSGKDRDTKADAKVDIKEGTKEGDTLASDVKELVSLLKKQGGRMTQKDIRKEFSLSEAKISLMISELEEKGIVKKIKKGRGNIILLNR